MTTPAPPEPANEEPEEVVPVPALQAEDQAELEHIAELLPEQERKQLYSIFQTVTHSGWLPPPQYLAQYEAVLPGLAERIVAMPEREQRFRHRVVEDVSIRDYKLKSRGQLAALVAMVLLLGFSAYLAYIGQAAWAGRVAMGTIVATVGIFVTGRVLDRKADKDESAED